MARKVGTSEYLKRRTENKEKREQYESSGVFKWSEETQIKPRVLRDLNNPDLIYQIGGQNAYVHTHKEYFRAGLETATREMNIMLGQLVANEQQKISQYVSLINQEWSTRLKKFFPGYLETFPQFQAFWNAVIMNEGNPNSLGAKLSYLIALKDATTKRNALKSFQDEMRQRVIREGIQPYSQAAVDFLNNKVNPYGFKITLSKNQKTYQWGGAGKEYLDELEKSIRQNSAKVLAQSEQVNADILDKIIDREIEKCIKGISDNTLSITATEMGNKFELLSEGIYQYVISDLAESSKLPNLIMSITNIAPERQTGGKHKDAVEKKGDTKITMTLGESKLEFVVSDKLSNTIDYQNVGINTELIDYFHASVESSTMDFSNFNIPNSVYNEHQYYIDKLFPYVFRNGQAFAGVVAIAQHGAGQPLFKDLVAMYAGWMKLVHQIVGNTINNVADLPLAIRTGHGLFNTADILSKFQNVDPTKILNVMDKSQLSSFLKTPPPIPYSAMHSLFVRKRMAMSHIQATGPNTYMLLKNSKYVSGWLENTPFDKVTMSSSFRIPLTNLETLFT
jgi:hypothetical protein